MLQQRGLKPEQGLSLLTLTTGITPVLDPLLKITFLASCRCLLVGMLRLSAVIRGRSFRAAALPLRLITTTQRIIRRGCSKNS